MKNLLQVALALQMLLLSGFSTPALAITDEVMKTIVDETVKNSRKEMADDFVQGCLLLAKTGEGNTTKSAACLYTLRGIVTLNETLGSHRVMCIPKMLGLTDVAGTVGLSLQRFYSSTPAATISTSAETQAILIMTQTWPCKP